MPASPSSEHGRAPAAADAQQRAVRPQRASKSRSTTSASSPKRCAPFPAASRSSFLSEGFDAKYLQGRDARDTRRREPRQRRRHLGPVLERRQRRALRQLVEPVAARPHGAGLPRLGRRAPRHRHPGRARAERRSSGSNFNSNAGLFTISRPTGGEVFQNSNDLKNNFDRMLRAQEVVYVLAFQAPSGNSGKFHDLKVKLVNARRPRQLPHRLLRKRRRDARPSARSPPPKSSSTTSRRTTFTSPPSPRRSRPATATRRCRSSSTSTAPTWPKRRAATWPPRRSSSTPSTPKASCATASTSASRST